MLLVVMSLAGGGCFLDHEVEPYYGRAVAPRAQEFRWSDGGLPQVFDPALAAVPPDTDAVRALYEGLTEYDPKSLAPVPGVASRWESSSDAREWTFHLRKDARWSNGEAVTAQDFVRSWQRIVQLGERAPHARLMKNIQGATPVEINPAPTPAPQPEPAQVARDANKKEETKKEAKIDAPKPQPFGVEAVDDYTLRVRLQRADAGFPALVSHPVFRPVYKLDSLFTDSNAASSTTRPVSNGAFQLAKIENEGVVLERAKNYWDAQSVSLQRVQFVPAKDAEAALAAYHAGEVDAVTNAGFEPLALKLLTPYKDFRRETFGALTYYSFNTSRPPFDDVRVREALTIAIDRDRISQDQLGGATEPAKKFLPAQTVHVAESSHAQATPIAHDVERARRLITEAGYPPEERKFPKVRLLVNRNAQQRQVAETIAAMWRSALGVETEIVLKDWEEYEIAYASGDYDVARRSYVMQTADDSSTLREMFEAEQPPAMSGHWIEDAPEKKTEAAENKSGEVVKEGKDVRPANEAQRAPLAPTPSPIVSEVQALKELPAMPIYFASSYALVKPYVVGFDTNLLDAPSLKHVRIDTGWQQPKQASLIWFKVDK
jgi:ABC-type oligopeptide transport system substrate-binding subunit